MIKKNYLALMILMYACTSMAQVKIGTNPTTVDPSAILEMESTTHGMLVPRMTAANRDAIATPANGLLIWNNSNNTFEVYKNTCSCWVTITDGGNTPANNLVNTAPTASTLNYTGTFRSGSSATIVYTYADAQNDLEGATTIQWEIANDNAGTGKANLSTGLTASFGVVNAGRWVRAKVTPRAATGILNGIDYFGAWTLITPANVPYGSALLVSGTVAQGSTLTGLYTFNGGTGVENTLGSTYIWQSANNNLGLNIQTMAIPDVATAHTTTIKPLSTEINKYIRFGVLAKDNASLQGTNYVYSSWVGPVTLATEAAPTALNVTYSPAPGTNIVLTASYQYSDVNNDPEGITTFQWYAADDVTGTNQIAISGATGTTFTVTAAQVGKFVGFGVTPKALTGTITGSEVVYYNASASASTATFSFVSATQFSNNYYANRTMDGVSDAISVTVDVTAAGSLSFSSSTVNGYSFSGGGVYTTGTQTIVLYATGLQTAYNGAGDNFTITGLGTSSLTTSLTISNVKVGADFTTHYNGITAGVSTNNLLATYTTGEVFSSNATCLTEPISASTCAGSSITVGSNTYSIANINGQCWMTQNLNELPNGIAVNASQWLATTQLDLGFYGYYNTVTPAGTSGWATTVPAASEGLIYQWSAAMLGSTLERTKGICPTGWHVPSDCEWMYLEHGQGMALSEQIIASSFRSNGTDNQGTPGYKLRSAGTGQTNASGFSGLLAGFRGSNGSFSGRAAQLYWWSSSATTATTAFYRNSNSGSRGVNRTSNSKANAFSVRCLKN
jgi:uncharacterized protein (TIGR02145 family)